MGIPGLNTWFKKSFSEAYVNLSTVKTDHLYIDMNSVLHLVLRRAKNMHQFYVLLFRKCDLILETCRPRKSVMFAMDGPAPIAKLLTQRIRRKRVTLSESDEKGKTVSPLALTPGTPFMQEIHEALAYFICQRLIGQKWLHLRMELSGSTVQGEGECKILARLQKPLEHVQPKDSHALIGNDSDLLMMSLMAESDGVYVFGQILDHPNDWPESVGKMRVFSVAKMTKPLADLLTSLKATPEQLKHHLRDIRRVAPYHPGRGNDYLPGVGGVSLDRVEDHYDGPKRENGLWKAYLQLKNGKEFRTRSLAMLRQGRIELDYQFLYELMETAGIRRSVRKSSDARKEPDPHLYLEGLRWILDMYSRGICPDYRYLYEGVGPSSQELCDAILEKQQSPQAQEMVEHGSTRLPLKPSECALALLPFQAQRYVAKPLQHLMEPDSPIGDLFQDCEECVQISQSTAGFNKEMASNSAQSTELKQRIEKLTADRAKTLEQRLERLEQKREALREKIRTLSARRESHMNEKHPYEPFPIGRIEEAVKKVPCTMFSSQDHELFSFGQAHVFQRSKKNQKISSPRLSLIRENPPEPPSGKFKRFKVPLPIIRYVSLQQWALGGDGVQGEVSMRSSSCWGVFTGGKDYCVAATTSSALRSSHVLDGKGDLLNYYAL